ncbi:MAG: insulinase family protein [Cyanobacteria bacterium P01_H01_bin.74]
MITVLNRPTTPRPTASTERFGAAVIPQPRPEVAYFNPRPMATGLPKPTKPTATNQWPISQQPYYQVNIPALRIQQQGPVMAGRLSNGVKAYMTPLHFVNRSAVSLKIPIGEVKPGTEALLLGLLSSGSEQTQALAEHISTRGMHLMFAVSDDQLIVSGSSPVGREAELLDHIFQLLLNPKVDEFTVNHLKEQYLQNKKSLLNDPDVCLNRRLLQEVYGKKHRYSISLHQQMKRIKNTSVDKLMRQFSTGLQSLSGLSVAMVSPYAASDQYSLLNNAIASAEKKYQWFPKNAVVASKTKLPEKKSEQPLVVQVNNTLKSALVKMQWTVPDCSDPDYPAFFLLSDILEGTSPASFFSTLRTRDGLVYSVSSHSGSPIGGRKKLYEVGLEVSPEKIQHSILDLREVTKKLCSLPIAPDVLQLSKRKFLLDIRDATQRSGTVLQFQNSWLKNNCTPVDLNRFLLQINAVTPQDIMRVANRIFNTESGAAYVITGVSAPQQAFSKENLPDDFKRTFTVIKTFSNKQ